MTSAAPANTALPTTRGSIGDTREMPFVVRFGLGGLAGIVGCTIVYPLDLAKTRLMNQRTAFASAAASASSTASGSAHYRGVADCLRKTIKHDGIRGLYRGLPANVVGITPEKAIKLSVNDYIRLVMRVEEQEARGVFPIIPEMFAAVTAAVCQVVATNPMEMVKIQCQVESGPTRKSAFAVAKDLGLRGLFQNSGATLLRDIPFTCMYFPLYAYFRMKTKQMRNKQSLNLGERLITATLAGTFAAGLTTPLDVVKTRLQAESKHSKAGNSSPVGAVPKYSGILDCFAKTVRNEGWNALWKGWAPRVGIIAPLFGITMTVFEVFQMGYDKLN